MEWCSGATVQQYNGPTVEECNSNTVQQCNSAMVEQLNSATVPFTNGFPSYKAFYWVTIFFHSWPFFVVKKKEKLKGVRDKFFGEHEVNIGQRNCLSHDVLVLSFLEVI